MKNKRGEQIVEAAIVLPILILTILSLLLLLVYAYTCLQNQTDLHTEMLQYVQDAEKPFEIYEKTTETSKGISGLAHILMNKKFADRVYVIRPADLMRAGEMIGLE